MKKLISLWLFAWAATSVQAQVEIRQSVSASVSDGHTPLWLNANRYGLSSLEETNGYVRAGAFRSLDNDSAKAWRWGAGVDVAVAAHYTSTLVVQQAYGELQWKRMRLTAGSKEQPMEMKNQELSTGSQTLGINARPVPEVRLSMPDYWPVPFTRGWLGVKGHLAYGKTTDDNWQKDFSNDTYRRTEDVLFTTKALYLKMGRQRVNFEFGLEMGGQFGGKTIYPEVTYNHDNSLKAFWKALFGGGTDVTDGDYTNAEGNHLGSWVARLNIDEPSWNLGLYADQFFDDNSMMLHVAYNGWGEGKKAYQKSRSRYFIYNFKDWLLGAELHLKNVSWLHHIVLEYMYTKYQGGPVYHDITTNMGEHITGRDNYYNHHLFTGWQHWGQVIGNPLYLSPIYNDDGIIRVYNNRFVAWHLGLSGDPTRQLHYRLLATYEKGYGSYDYLYMEPRRDVSVMAEASYRFPQTSRLAGWFVKGAFGLDDGKLFGNNVGGQLTVGKTLWVK